MKKINKTIYSFSIGISVKNLNQIIPYVTKFNE